MQSAYLIDTLVAHTRQLLDQARGLKEASMTELTWRPAPEAWNILECLEHLNLYGDFYLPEIEKSIQNSKTSSDAKFRPGLLGNYFAESMLPKAKLSKMKTFKNKNPLRADLDKAVIDRFIAQQLHLLQLLEAARQVSLNKIKIKTTLSGLLRLKLGDTFRFFVHHNIRHGKQIAHVTARRKATGAHH